MPIYYCQARKELGTKGKRRASACLFAGRLRSHKHPNTATCAQTDPAFRTTMLLAWDALFRISVCWALIRHWGRPGSP